jgi:formate hydrogenlyase transcriptional activator
MDQEKKSAVLIIDDEPFVAHAIADAMELNDYLCYIADNGQQGLDLFRQRDPDVVLVDLRMPEVNGLEVIKSIKKWSPDTPQIVVSGTDDINEAVEALRCGAWDYIFKPIGNSTVLVHAVERALEQGRLIRENRTYHEQLEEMVQLRTVELKNALAEVERLKNQLQEENIYLREEIKLEHNFETIIGSSDALRNVLRQVEIIAPSDTTILIRGETGTGKELIARAIHSLSLRKNRPLVKVNCAALPPNLIESELFGHEKGAFTGAVCQRKGRFELADGGTIFLDEISELSLDLQVKLLRVLQEGEFERVGGVHTLKVDVRVITATNRDLDKAVRQGIFRQDLYYRLNVVPIELPPLRERKEDIPALAKFFAQKYAKKIGKKFDNISRISLKILESLDWPGNIRELENIIERAVVFSKEPVLSIQRPVFPVDSQDYKRRGLGTLESVEREYIISVLQEKRWVVEGENGAAKILGLHPNTLRSRMKKLQIKKPVAI